MLVSRIKDKQVALGLVPASKPEEPTPPPTAVPSAAAQSSIPSVTPVMMHPYYVAEPVISAAPVRYNLNPEKEAEPVPKPAVTAAVAAAVAVPAVPVVSGPVMSTVPSVALPTHTLSHTIVASAKETLRKSSVSAVTVRSDAGSRSNSPHVFPSITTPQPDMQIIIDKMASYVAKNGKDFESIVRNKGDPRFAFLEPSHPYNPYYRHKISVYAELEGEQKVKESAEEEVGAEVAEEGEGEGEDGRPVQSPPSEGAEEVDEEEEKGRGKPAPVSFSIKKPKEAEGGLEKRSALPVEESSDEEGEQEGEKSKPESRTEKPVVVVPEAAKEPVIAAVSSKEEAEVIDLTEDTPPVQVEKRSGSTDKRRWEEERLKDKLAAAAREKLAAAAREKQLQAERKRRAAAFLHMIGREHPSARGAAGPRLAGPLPADGTPLRPLPPPRPSPPGSGSDVSSLPSPLRPSSPPSPSRSPLPSPLPSPQSSEVPSPPHIGRQDLQERLSPKYNGEVRCTTSLYARIQASNSSLRKLREGGCGSEVSSRLVEVRGSHKRRHLSDHEGSRPHIKGDEDSSHRHKKTKKKEHRARSHSRPHGSQSSHSHYQPYRSGVEWDQHRHKKKKKKKKSHHRSSSESS